MQIYTDEECLEHGSPPGFPEVPRRLEGILERLEEEGREVVRAGEHPDLDAAVIAVHDERYVERFRRAVERGDGLLDSADNPLSPGTWRAARAATSAVLHAVDEVVEGDAAALAAVRPPGHHAERDRAMGFCFFNHVAIAAERLVARYGLEPVAIFDFDVHHGNGTQHLFEERGDVLFVSTHQYPFYPGTGAADERGRGAGRGWTLNVPLPAGTGDDGYGEAIRERVLPAIREARPAALLVSAGFDAWRGDPVGGMRVGEESFGEWGRRLGELAVELCGGRLFATLEGGYDLDALPGLVSAFVAGVEAPDRA